LQVHEVYDPVSDTWSIAAPLPAGRNSCAGVTLDGALWLIGGEDPGETRVYPQTWIFDPVRNSWRDGPALTLAVQGVGAVAVGGTIYLPGGGPVAGGSRQTSRLQIFMIQTAP
jgi:N-acetylneuraminic acid mutarotase